MRGRIPLENASVGDHPEVLAALFVYVWRSQDTPALDVLRGCVHATEKLAARVGDGVTRARDDVAEEIRPDIMGLDLVGYPAGRSRNGITRTHWRGCCGLRRVKARRNESQRVKLLRVCNQMCLIT